MTRDLDLKREAIALAAARHAAFDGWSERALIAAARELGYAEGEIRLLFPSPVADWIAAFSASIDRAMLKRVETHPSFAALKIREKIALCVRSRLTALSPYRESVRRLQGALLFPPGRALLALKLTHRMTDAIWRKAGDASADFNYYTKRGLLAGVYATTQLYWLNDTSENSAASWAFLDRRIGNVLKIGQALGRLKKAS